MVWDRSTEFGNSKGFMHFPVAKYVPVYILGLPMAVKRRNGEIKRDNSGNWFGVVVWRLDPRVASTSLTDRALGLDRSGYPDGI